MRNRTLLTLCLAVATTACAAEEPRGHAGTPEDPFVIGMSQSNLGEPWRVQLWYQGSRARCPNASASSKYISASWQASRCWAQSPSALAASAQSSSGPAGQVLR